MGRGARETNRTLADLASGDYGLLAEPQVHGDHRRRLTELGFRQGQVVQVLQRSVGGARVVSLHGSRIAVDVETARALPIEERA